MPSVVLIFQIHQPFRLRKYSVFDTEPLYFDDVKNAEILRKVADKCYRPATRLMLDLARKHNGLFRLAYAISGTALEQLERWAPDVIETLQELVKTGCCELVCETSHHSLAALFSPDEFARQVEAHARKLQHVFGIEPLVCRNTELIYSNAIAQQLSKLPSSQTQPQTQHTGNPRFIGVLAEGTDTHIHENDTQRIYAAIAPDGSALTGRDGASFMVLPRHYRLSDDIGFRFSNRSWSHWPLTPAKFASWIATEPANIITLCMDYETIGEHQWAETGIFDFFAGLPDALVHARMLSSSAANLSAGNLSAGNSSTAQDIFLTPSQALRMASATSPLKPFNVSTPTSWADTERDTSAWLGNDMQTHALEELAALEPLVFAKVIRTKAAGSGVAIATADALLSDWRKLTTSDHFYYMCTKYFADGAVHTYFNPYDSPYDSYINFMNVLDNIKSRVAE